MLLLLAFILSQPKPINLTLVLTSFLFPFQKYKRRYNLINMKHVLAIEESLYLSQNKDRFSGTTCSSNSIGENIEVDFQQGSCIIPLKHDLRFELFESYDELPDLSQKMCQRTVSWIMTLCWTRNISDQCLWSTLLLFYSLKNQKKIKKDQLQPTVLGCLSISLKLFSPGVYTLKDLTSFSSKSIKAIDLVEIQSLILLHINFNAVIPHYISQIYNCSVLSPQNIVKLGYLCQLYMIKNHQIFLDREKIQDLIKMITEQDQDCNSKLNMRIREQIKNILQLKQSKIVLNKYAPKFDIHSFNKMLI